MYARGEASEISTEKTISALKVDSKVVIGTIKNLIVTGIESAQWVGMRKSWDKESSQKIEELIKKTADPKTPIKELLKIKKDINQPHILLAMDDEQRKRYHEALKLRHPE